MSISAVFQEVGGVEQVILEYASGERFISGPFDAIQHHEKGTVLYAENSDNYRHTIALFLREEGYNVLEARSAAEAVAIVRELGGKGIPHLLLSDIVMPESEEGLAYLNALHPPVFPSLVPITKPDANGLLIVTYLICSNITIPKIMLTSEIALADYQRFRHQFDAIDMTSFPKANANNGYRVGLCTQVDYAIRNAHTTKEELRNGVANISTHLASYRSQETYGRETDFDTAIAGIILHLGELEKHFRDSRDYFGTDASTVDSLLSETQALGAEVRSLFSQRDRDLHDISNKYIYFIHRLEELEQYREQFETSPKAPESRAFFESNPFAIIEEHVTRANHLLSLMKNPLSGYRDEHVLKEVIAAIQQEFEASFRAEGVVFFVDYEDVLGHIPVNDAYKETLTQIVRNALDATPRGGKVEIGVTGDLMCLTTHVVDTGSGISPDVLSYIWNEGCTTKPGHWGTGLQRVRDLARTYRFSVDVETTGPEGTSFIIQYPLTKRYNLPDKIIRRMCLICVDDDSSFRKVFSEASQRGIFVLPEIESEAISVGGLEELQEKVTGEKWQSLTDNDYVLILLDYRLGESPDTQKSKEVVAYFESLGLPAHSQIVLYSGYPYHLEWNRRYPEVERGDVFNLSQGFIRSLLSEHNRNYK
ncbi:hypothetical protein COY95_05270 [Candidatus Woesearchaeota archaeon CG_4_10_14_0_8_um_filter_47_5]|nr:MAG: hypothetical protein COY95_05270 [Candidatus Woesearchaeota archaeon CG_4_10_14_0_8_um_filter_47_5]